MAGITCVFVPRIQGFILVVVLTLVLVYAAIKLDIYESNTTKHKNPNVELETEVCFSALAGNANTEQDCPFLRYAFIKDPPAQILTLFTVETDYDKLQKSGQEQIIRNSTIKNWKALKALIQPVLIRSRESLKDIDLLEYEWQVNNTQAHNLTKVKDIFKHIESKSIYHRPFFGYAKPNLLFSFEFMKTITYVSRIPSAKLSGNGLLIVGKSTGLLSSLSRNASASVKSVAELASSHGFWMSPHVHDYIITTKRGFPWRDLPDFVAGHEGYTWQEWVLSEAHRRNITVIDISQTAPVLHQTVSKGDVEDLWESDLDMRTSKTAHVTGRHVRSVSHRKTLRYNSDLPERNYSNDYRKDFLKSTSDNTGGLRSNDSDVFMSSDLYFKFTLDRDSSNMTDTDDQIAENNTSKENDSMDSVDNISLNVEAALNIKSNVQKIKLLDHPDLICYNERLVNADSLDRGSVLCAPYFTRYDESGRIRLYRRNGQQRDCDLSRKQARQLIKNNKKMCGYV